MALNSCRAIVFICLGQERPVELAADLEEWDYIDHSKWSLVPYVDIEALLPDCDFSQGGGLARRLAGCSITPTSIVSRNENFCDINDDEKCTIPEA